MKKIAHLTTAHPPFDVRIFHKMCVSLAQSGYDTHLVATHPQDETVNGVHLHGLPKPSSRLERFTQATKHCLQIALSLDADLYHFHDPELLKVGMKLKSLGKTVVYDVHENYAGCILDREYLPKAIRPFMASHVKRLENKADRILDAVVAATPVIAKQFNNPNTVTVQNFPVLSEFPEASGSPYASRPSALTYAGGLTEIRGLTQCVQAVAQVEEATLNIAGKFTSSAYEQSLKAEPGWAKVNFVGWLDRSQIARLLGQSRAGLSVLHPARNHIESQPLKVFEYMAAGLPVIVSNFPLWKKIVEDDQIGFCVDPFDVKAIAQAVQYILEHPQESEEMGHRGRKAVEAKYSWEPESQKLVALYQTLIGPVD